jgi:hypothetical protein
MASPKSKPYPSRLREMMAEKTAVLSKAQTLADIGMAATAQPLWTTAAGYEERIAPLLEAVGRDLEAAIHRISAASCYRQAGELSRAVNLLRAALAGPLHDTTRQEVGQMLLDCRAELARTSFNHGTSSNKRRVPAGT